jgi:hypothetical protein
MRDDPVFVAKLVRRLPGNLYERLVRIGRRQRLRSAVRRSQTFVSAYA